MMVGDTMETETGETQHAGDNKMKKKQSVLSEVLVTGLLKNINDKVQNKLDHEAQSELAGIVSSKVKEAGMEEAIKVTGAGTEEAAISFDSLPGSDHLLPSAAKGRVSPPRTLKSRSSSHRDSLEEDFENLLKDEDIDIDEEVVLSVRSTEEEGEKCPDSYLDDFEALLASSSSQFVPDCDQDQCDIEADFDALIEEENVVVENPPNTKKETAPEISEAEDCKEEPELSDNDEHVAAGVENIVESHNQSSCSEEPEQNKTITQNERDVTSGTRPVDGDDQTEVECGISRPQLGPESDRTEGGSNDQVSQACSGRDLLVCTCS